MFLHVKNVHFVGIGGIGMSGIAEVLCDLGFIVSGSDIKKSKNTDRLEKMGARIAEGHNESNLGDAQVVVYSSAVKDDNPEVWSRKTERCTGHSTRRNACRVDDVKALRSCYRRHAWKDKYYINGGDAFVTCGYGSDGGCRRCCRIRSAQTLGLANQNGSLPRLTRATDPFLMLYPTIAVVTNIDKEHMESYKGMDDVVQCFTDFVNKIPFYGAASFVSMIRTCS